MKQSRRAFLKLIASAAGAEAIPGDAGAFERRPGPSVREVIDAAAYGVSADASAEQNSRGLLRIREKMRGSDTAFDLILPDGRLNILTGRWLQGVADVHVRGGRGTQLCNVGTSQSTTERVPLIINQDYFLDHAGSIPGFGEFVNGDRIGSVAAGTSHVRLSSADAASKYRAGMPVLVYGFNQDSQGYPPSIRYFERNTVAKVGADTVELAVPLRNAYDARWADIVQNGDEAYRAADATGAARILSLDRAGFRVATRIVLDDLEFLSSRDRRDADVSSLDGSLYAFSSDLIVCNRVRVNGYFYPSASGTIVVNDSYIRFVENDKLVDRIEYNRCRIGFFSNGPAVNQIVVNDSTIEEPIPIVSCRNVEFNDVTFVGARRAASAFVTLSFSTPMESVVFNRPRLVPAQGTLMPLTTGGGVVRVKVTGMRSGVLYTDFSGINDPVPRGLTIGSVLRNESGQPQFDVTGIWLESGRTAIGVKARDSAVTVRVNQVLMANICKRLTIVDPAIVGAQSDMEARFSSPRSISEASFDVAVQLNADDARIRDAHHDDDAIDVGFDFGGGARQRPFDLTIHRRARELAVEIGDAHATAGSESSATLMLTGLDYTGRPVWRGAVDMSAPGIRTIGERHVLGMSRDQLTALPNVRIVRLRVVCNTGRSALATHVKIKILLTDEVNRDE
ncbi:MULTISPECIES: hypothetical protein [unclassified Burkholderia]|uniref:hypothetical protein n=1 Tax=unclassified Burkholderia TaxID=2613784 RepID=UPI002AB13FEF|nr:MULTISPECIES: hypothetical protein [unclassified Burkholderia]